MNRRFMFVAVVLSSLPLAALAQDEGGLGGMTVGVGAGYEFPQSILEPNTVSLRLRMGAMTFEPLVSLGGGNASTKDTASFTSGSTNTTTTTSDSSNGLGLTLAGNFLYSLANAGPMSFHVIGGLEFRYINTTTIPSFAAPIMKESSTDTTMSVGLNWGVAVEWAFTKNFVASAEATNPLVTWSSVKTVDHVETNVPTTSDVTHEESGLMGGLTLMPTVRLLFHLYF